MGVPARLDGVDLLPCNGARSSFQETLNVTAVAAKACCRQGLPRRRHLARPLGPPRDRDRRDRDARPHGHPRGVRLAPAPQGRPHHRLAPHDHPDGRPDRDAQGPRRRGPLGLVQHLLDPGSRRRRHRRRRHPRLRLQGRVPRGVLGLHPQDLRVGRRRLLEHDPRRRRGRHPAAPPRRPRRGRHLRPRQALQRGGARPLRRHQEAGSPRSPAGTPRGSPPSRA